MTIGQATRTRISTRSLVAEGGFHDGIKQDERAGRRPGPFTVVGPASSGCNENGGSGGLVARNAGYRFDGLTATISGRSPSIPPVRCWTRRTCKPSGSRLTLRTTSRRRFPKTSYRARERRIRVAGAPRGRRIRVTRFLSLLACCCSAPVSWAPRFACAATASNSVELIEKGADRWSAPFSRSPASLPARPRGVEVAAQSEVSCQVV